MFRVIRFDVIRVIKVCNSRCDTYSNYLKLPYYQEKKKQMTTVLDCSNHRLSRRLSCLISEKIP